MRFVARSLGLAVALLWAASLSAQDFSPPRGSQPTEKVRQQIVAKTRQLEEAVAGLRKKGVDDALLVDVEVFARAADMILKLGEFYQKDSPAWTLAVLDHGLERVRLLAKGEAPWTKAAGQTVVRGYRSKIDGTVQPLAVTYPLDYGKDPKRKWRVDVVLHGRNATLTEVSFLHSNGNKKAPPAEQDWVQLDVFGRGNNAYRWAGETDVIEAMFAFYDMEMISRREDLPDARRLVLRGFSMGGAGTWHLGLHRPHVWAVIGPGAGFTTTHGYTKLPPLPPYQEACLHIYDAVDYAANASIVPIVAYSGSEDKQKAAADNIEKRLKGLGLADRMIHLVAPGLGHKFPPEWFRKANESYAKFVAQKKEEIPQRILFETYTTKYPGYLGIMILGLERHYERARVEVDFSKTACTIKTRNVRCLKLLTDLLAKLAKESLPLIIDGQNINLQVIEDQQVAVLQKSKGAWQSLDAEGVTRLLFLRQKEPNLQGPIDDAFSKSFLCVRGTGQPWHAEVQQAADARLDRFAKEWAKYWRGSLPVKNDTDVTDKDIRHKSLILFGDPSSNSLIAHCLKELPLQWTKDAISFAGKKYAAAEHLPVLIYPCPLNPNRYVVLNTGHTIPTEDYNKTNALLFPRLGDYAILTTKGDVVTAGLFNEFWQIDARDDEPIVPKGAQLEKLWGEGEFTEGPAYGPGGFVYFSDIGNRILKFDPRTGKTTAFRESSGRANGLDFDKQGRLVAAEGANTGGNRRVTRTEKDGTVRVLADKWQGKRFNSPNDLTIDTKSRVYFTDPRYVGDEPREIDTESVYRIDPDGSVTQIITDVQKPNGIVLSPDMKWLYLADNNAKGNRHLLKFALKDDGSVGPRQVLHDFAPDRGIDGMCIDEKGNVYATAGQGKTGGVYVFNPDGKKIGFIPTPETPTNCTFGGPDRKTLYVTAGRSLYRVRLNVPGFAVYWPEK